MEQLVAVINTDKVNRYVGITDDLFTLNDIQEKTWNNSLPTLTKKHDNIFTKITDIVFKEKFFNKFKYLKNIDFTNLLIAGGCIKSILCKTDVNDIDIFIYGITDINIAQKRIEKFITELQEILKSFILTSNIHELCYNGSTITFYIGTQKIQIILRLYNTLSEILHGFDLGSSAVGFDKEQVYFTTLSKYCYENMVNIFDVSRKSYTYEYRLIKYFLSGFDIILQNFDIKKLEKNKKCYMPYIQFNYNHIIGNMIIVEHITSKYLNIINLEYDEINDIDEYNFNLKYYNIYQLVNNTNKHIKTMEFKNNDFLKFQYFKNQQFLKFNFENTLKISDIDTIYDILYQSMCNNIPSIKIISRYFNIKLQDFYDKVYNNNILDEQNLKDIIEEQKISVKNKLYNDDNYKINWITENPMAQLTSSINPIIETNEKWYGVYYINI